MIKAHHSDKNLGTPFRTSTRTQENFSEHRNIAENMKMTIHADTKQEGNGLGLSIVKQICTVAGYLIKYRFTDNRHEFTVAF